MFVISIVLVVLAGLAFWAAHRLIQQRHAETAQLVSILLGVLAALFFAGGIWKWGTAG